LPNVRLFKTAQTASATIFGTSSSQSRNWPLRVWPSCR